MKIDQGQLYQTQISLSEWFEKSGNKNTEAHRLEDNEKRERLKILNEVINLSFDKPTQFSVEDIANKTSQFKEFLKEHGDELCGLRLIPNNPNLPKLRIRGKTIKDSLSWFEEQNINPESYRADFIPHSDSQKWSTIFIVNQNGIFGEIIKGGSYQLTQGFYDDGEPITFYYDFKKLTLSQPDANLEDYLKNVFEKIKITDSKKRNLLEEKLDSTFSNNYLCGYFETVDTEEFGLWFTDYNRLIDKAFEDYAPSKDVSTEDILLKGLAGSSGKITGRARIVGENYQDITLEEGEILVCTMTTPNHLPLIQQAAAIVTDFGGILSHAAIICRELNKPCITSTKTATQVLKDGDLIVVDADQGIITYDN